MFMAATRPHEPRRAVPHAGILQRKCASCGDAPGASCPDCERQHLQRKESGSAATAGIPPIVHSVVRAPGRPLDPGVRAFMEPRFAHDFSRVRVHTGAEAAASARAVNAHAYTLGSNVVFGNGQYAPDAPQGRRLLAHELAHVVQQSSTSMGGGGVGAISSPAEHEADSAADAVSRGDRADVRMRVASEVARAPCTSAAICGGGPVVGSAQEADVTGTSREVGPRDRRKKMTPARAVATGHGGRALQLEKLFEKAAPGKLSSLQGVFIDQDISSSFGATTISCAQWITESLPAGSPTPAGMAGAAKPCTFVHDVLNQQALAFNTTSDATIGGVPRAQWQTETLEMLMHESEHPRYDAASPSFPLPAGITSPTCTRGAVAQELTEIAAMLSEFPIAFQAASGEASATGPLHKSLDRWFDATAQSGGENIKSAIQQMGCHCSCPEVDAFVKETFNFESGTWSVAQKDALHRELKKPKWGLNWPLSPSTP
jgi:uncharacterized protein DUF4157